MPRLAYKLQRKPASPAQHPPEDRVHIPKLPRVVERLRQSLRREQCRNLWVLRNFFTKNEIVLPCPHGVALHEAVGIFAQHACLGKVEQELTREDEAAGGFEVLLHAFGVDEKPIDQI